MAKMMPELKSSKVITRYNGGEPILSKKDIQKKRSLSPY